MPSLSTLPALQLRFHCYGYMPYVAPFIALYLDAINMKKPIVRYLLSVADYPTIHLLFKLLITYAYDC